MPRELCDLIYINVFTSTRISSGERATGSIKIKTIKPAPNSLAILYSCRQIHDEVELSWLHHILFSFGRPVDMLHKLSPLPTSTLSQIRHIRTAGNIMMLQTDQYGDDTLYKLVSITTLLPALRLDELIIFGPPHGYGHLAYDILEELLTHGGGWKELYFVTRDSEMLGFAKKDTMDETAYWHQPYGRQPQPSTWNEILLQRDGKESGASVSIYRATKSDAPGAVFNLLSRQVFEQKASLLDDLTEFGEKEDETLMATQEKGKELLVVAKRGHGIDIREHGWPPTFHLDHWHWARSLTWLDIRGQSVDYFGDEEEFLGDADEDDDDCEVDAYSSVGEYKWPNYC